MQNLTGMMEMAGKDVYKIRNYGQRAFDYVIDIGANVGQFSLTAFILFPFSKIIAYEPCIESYKLLCSNINCLPIETVNMAIGDGSPLHFKPSGGRSITCTGNLFKKRDTGGYKINSITIDKLFQKHKIDTSKNILLKIDCEGGEQYIIQDKYKDLLLSCKHICMEIHFQCPKYRYFDDLPEWGYYNTWVRNCFGAKYNILYYLSRARTGLGTYIITRK